MSQRFAATPPCLACPKLCSDVCPTHEASAREALTPWAKVTLAALSTAPGEQPGTSAAEALAACTGCLRCTAHCPHGFEVTPWLENARASAARAGTFAAGARPLPLRFASAGHGEERDLRAVHRALHLGAAAAAESAAAASDAARASQPRMAPRLPAFAPQAERSPIGRPLLFTGCDALATGGTPATQALAVAAALGAPLRLVPEGVLCCGLKLAEAGHPELFAAHAARVSRALAGEGKRPRPVHLVFLAPGCARAVLERWTAVGAGLPEGSLVEHVTSFLARALVARPDLASRPRLPGAITWHAPCQLARGLSEITAPRALLAAAVEEVREPARTGSDTSCCGFGGLLPRTLPELAREMARLRHGELRDCGAPVVTASPGCAQQLGAADLVSVVARWLGVG